MTLVIGLGMHIDTYKSVSVAMRGDLLGLRFYFTLDLFLSFSVHLFFGGVGGWVSIVQGKEIRIILRTTVLNLPIFSVLLASQVALREHIR